MSANRVDLNDLGLDLVPHPGRRPKALSAEFVRELTVADLAMPPAAVQTAPPLKAIRDRHHALARVLALGTSEGEASIITGYAPSRISILKADPQFQQLLEFYRQDKVQIVADLRERMGALGLAAAEELLQRLDENPEELSPGLLKDLLRDMADRTGHAPSRTQVNVNINENLQDRMQRARERLSKVIDHE